MQINRRKNILFVLPALTSGGAERVLITLMNGVDRDLYKPSLLSVIDKGELGYLVDRKTPHYKLKRDSVLKSAPQIYGALKRLKPDIVVSTMAHMNFTVMALKPFFPNTSFIVREAITPSFLLDKYKSRSFIIKSLYKRYYPNADAVISPAEIILNEFETKLSLSPHNFLLLRNPVDTEAIRSQDNFQPIAPDREKTVQFVSCGRLHRQKGYDRLIEHLSKTKLPYNWKLTIFGEGDERQSLETQIKDTGLSENIQLAGLVKKPYAKIAQADCLLLPSRYEGLPNVVLESLACGTPVIATVESGGIAEIAKETPESGLKVSSSIHDFVSEMKKVSPNPTSSYRQSLLPDTYLKSNVINRFNEILELTPSSRKKLSPARQAA